MTAPSAVATRMTTTRDISSDQKPKRTTTGPAFCTAKRATPVARSRNMIRAVCPTVCSFGEMRLKKG
jgi:hypothetical protein